MMTSNAKYLAGGLAVAAMLAILFAIPKMTGEKQTSIRKLSSGLKVRCIDNAPAIAIHIHPELEIYVDGVRENLPGGIGISPNCVSEIHTHRVNDQIHIELLTDHPVTLGDFFEFWVKPLQRDGYNLEIIVNGQSNQELDKLVLKDKDKIVLKYTSQ